MAAFTSLARACSSEATSSDGEMSASSCPPPQTFADDSGKAVRPSRATSP